MTMIVMMIVCGCGFEGNKTCKVTEQEVWIIASPFQSATINDQLIVGVGLEKVFVECKERWDAMPRGDGIKEWRGSIRSTDEFR